MTIQIGPVEWFWLIVNGSAVVITLLALHDTYLAHREIVRLNGRAREILAAGNVRRELVRLASQVLLVAAILPSLFDDRDIQLTPTVFLLMLLPPVLLLNSLFDTVDRRRLLGIVDDEIVAERIAAIKRIEAQAKDTNRRVRGIELEGQRVSDEKVIDDGLAVDTNERVQVIEERTSGEEPNGV